MISPGPQFDVVLKRFERPTSPEFTRGRFELVTIGGMTIGRANLSAGWKWSVDVGPTVGTDRCRVEHLGLVLQGRAVRVRRWAGFGSWRRVPCSYPREPHDIVSG